MNSTNLLKHQLNKYGVVTVMDVMLRDPESKEPVLLLDTLKVTSINQEGEQKTIRGGIGAPELISYDFARTISVEIQDALASMASLKILWGGRFLKDKISYTGVFEAKVEAENKVTVPSGITVKTGAAKADLATGIAIGAKATYTLDSITGSEITLAGGTPKVGEVVKVFLPAEVAVSDDAVALAINSIDLPPTLHFTGKTFFIDQATGKKIQTEIEIPLFKVNIGGGLAMEAEGDAAVFDFNGKALKDPLTNNFFILKQLGKEG